MRYTIDHQPTYSILEVELRESEELVSEAGAMAWMSENVRLQTTARGGAIAGLKRTFLTGESFFQNTYRAEGGNGVIGLAPGQSGNIIAHDLNRDELLLEKNAYLASTPDIHTDSNFQGLRGLFNEGLFVLTVSGTGTLFFNGYGDIEKIDVDGSYVIDNGHAVAWEPQPPVPPDEGAPDTVVPVLGPGPHAIRGTRQALGAVTEPPNAGGLGVPVQAGGLQGRRRLTPLPLAC